MVCSSFSLVCLSLATILLASAVHATTGTVDMCKATRFQPLCRQVVKKTDAVTATEAAINASIKETKNAKQEANRLGKENELGTCNKMLDDAIKNLDEALKNIKGNAKESLNTNLSAAMSNYATCDDSYTISGGTSPLANTSTKLQHMVSNCLALAAQIR